MCACDWDFQRDPSIVGVTDQEAALQAMDRKPFSHSLSLYRRPSSYMAFINHSRLLSLLPFFLFLLPFFLSLRAFASASVGSSTESTPVPTPSPWPEQFHSVLFMNHSGALSLIDLWYDWPNGRNFNIIQDQLGGPPLYDLEWNNGTSFWYTLPSSPSPSCRSTHLPVGILRPNWLDGATYLGRVSVDGFLCDHWEKADFIRYYEDVATRRPVHWVFYTGRAAHVMTFDVGAVLGDEHWQAPVYCFKEGDAANGGGGSEALDNMMLQMPLLRSEIQMED